MMTLLFLEFVHEILAPVMVVGPTFPMYDLSKLVSPNYHSLSENQTKMPKLKIFSITDRQKASLYCLR